VFCAAIKFSKTKIKIIFCYENLTDSFVNFLNLSFALLLDLLNGRRNIVCVCVVCVIINTTFLKEYIVVLSISVWRYFNVWITFWKINFHDRTRSVQIVYFWRMDADGVASGPLRLYCIHRTYSYWNIMREYSVLWYDNIIVFGLLFGHDDAPVVINQQIQYMSTFTFVQAAEQ